MHVVTHACNHNPFLSNSRLKLRPFAKRQIVNLQLQYTVLNKRIKSSQCSQTKILFTPQDGAYYAQWGVVTKKKQIICDNVPKWGGGFSIFQKCLDYELLSDPILKNKKKLNFPIFHLNMPK